MSDHKNLDPYNIKEQSSRSVNSARIILPLLFDIVPNINSILDIGCGCGGWLKVASELGIQDVFGIDGKWTPIKDLSIDKKNFKHIDFEHSFKLEKTFDLGICLEVAEHISLDSACRFVNDVCKTSDIILFSAAIPGQGGTHHVNEQYPSYWSSHFKKNGFATYDPFRERIFSNLNLPYWFRQNLLLFSNCPLNGIQPIETPNSYIHFELYEKKITEIKNLKSVTGSFRSLRKALKRKLFMQLKS